MKMRMKAKKLTALVLTLLLMASMIPMTALAGPGDPITININTPAGGTVTADDMTPSAPQKITLTVTPVTGYFLQSLTAKNTANADANVPVSDTNTFEYETGMKVVVDAVFAKKIDITQSTGGTITTDTSDPAAGAPVIITVDLTAGYFLKTKTPTVKNGATPITPKDNGNGTYTFTYEAGAVVTIGAEYAKKITYAPSPANGKLKVEPENPNDKEKVVITVDPDNTYVMKTLTVQDAGSNINPTDNKDGTHTFVYTAGAVVTIDAEFAKKITPTQNSNGKIEVDPPEPADNTDVKITVKPDPGYIMTTLTVKDAVKTITPKNNNDGTYTFKYEARAAVSVEAQFAKSITINNTNNGKVTVDPSAPKANELVTITTLPNTDFIVGRMVVKNGTTNLPVTALAGGKYTFRYPANGVVTIDVLYTKGLILANADNGTMDVTPVAPADKQKVTVTVTPDSGYRVSGATAKNGSLPVELTDEGNGKYSFIYTAGATVTVSAVFVKGGIDIIKTENGTLAVDKPSPKAGDIITITPTPAKGYALKDITVMNGSTVIDPKKNTDDGTYTFTYPAGTNVVVTIDAEFLPGVSVSKPENGTVKADKLLPNANDPVTITVTPNKGFKFKSLTVKNDKEDVTWKKNANGTYTFNYPAGGKVNVEVLFESTIPFTDVPADQWYYNAVVFVYENNLFAGTSATTFTPAKNMTRGMMVQVLFNMTDGAKKSDVKFDDVPDGKWYSDAVSWAAKNGIVTGVGNNRFAPLSDITREQMALMLYNYANYMKIKLPNTRTAGSFVDASSISSWAKDAVNAMYAAEIINGKDGNRFDPLGFATRAHGAEIFMNYSNAVNK